MIIETIYGSLTITDPLLKELITSPAMQRLKKIRQHGTADYHSKAKAPFYYRFEHSLGVLFLLERYKTSRYEQVAGLLHDVSHTVFSHAADSLFITESSNDFYDDSYQDSIHKEFLEQYDIAAIAQRYTIPIDLILHKNSDFKALEQPIPHLCADRIEYNLFTGLLDNLITKQQLNALLDSLQFDGEQWFFTCAESAYLFASIPLYEMPHRWSSIDGILGGLWTSQALSRAWQLGVITSQDIHFNLGDDAMWSVLTHCPDQTIQELLDKIQHPYQYYTKGSDSTYTLRLRSKFRGVDPLVRTTMRASTSKTLKRLSELNSSFRREYCTLWNYINSGWPVILAPQDIPHHTTSIPTLHV